MRRRTVLASLAPVGGGTIAGCVADTDSLESPSFFYSLFNYLSQSETLRVQIAGGDGPLVAREVVLEPREAREHVPLSEAPTRARITAVDEGIERTIQWPTADYCGTDGRASGKPGLEAQVYRDDRTVDLFTEWSCQTVEGDNSSA